MEGKCFLIMLKNMKERERLKLKNEFTLGWGEWTNDKEGCRSFLIKIMSFFLWFREGGNEQFLNGGDFSGNETFF